MHASKLFVLLGALAVTLAGCPLNCPTGEDESPSVSSVEGTLSVQSNPDAEAETFELSSSTATSGQCRVGGISVRALQEGSESLARPSVRITCNATVGLPLVNVELPDLREIGVTTEPLDLTSNVTFLGSHCDGIETDVPTTVSVLAASGSPSSGPEIVTEDYFRDFEVTFTLEGGSHRGTIQGSACSTTSSPPAEVHLRVTTDASDFGPGRTFCG